MSFKPHHNFDFPPTPFRQELYADKSAIQTAGYSRGTFYVTSEPNVYCGSISGTLNKADNAFSIKKARLPSIDPSTVHTVFVTDALPVPCMAFYDTTSGKWIDEYTQIEVA